MGLKIGYYFTFRGSRKELLCKVRGLHEQFKDTPVER